MGLEKLESGNIPEEINVVIEIASNSSPVKYELNKKSGLITVDRFLSTAMSYPCEYGFVPHTLSLDGDPVDVLLVSPFSLMPGVLVLCRPVGMLEMTDESGIDTKILAVPVSKLTTQYDHIHKPEDLGKEKLAMIEHFFTHYKDLDAGRWAKIKGWRDVEMAKKEIMESVRRFEAA